MNTALPALAGALLVVWGLASVQAEESQPPTVEIVSKQLNEARNFLLPEVGSTVYRFTQDDITNLPLGDATPFNQLLLQAPGVVQDSFGQLHVRGDHADLQYRINGVIIPESISGFGQALDTRFFDSVNLITGALPAQYGYRTAGVVDIHTKTGALNTGGNASLTVGSFWTINPSVEYGGTSDRLDYYVTAQYLYDQIGIENPTNSYYPIHDNTSQGKAFAYASYLLSNTSRVSFFLGSSNSYFQVPNSPGVPPAYSLDGTVDSSGNIVPTPFNSADLNETQRELTYYGVAAYQDKPSGLFDYQVALFSRYTSTNFFPDLYGDLTFNGVASDVFQSSWNSGVQADGAYRLTDVHTLRGGFNFSIENAINNNTSYVFPGQPGAQTPGQGPFPIVQDAGKVAYLYGIYIQDEWRPTQVLTVNFGVRADLMNAYVNAGQISPRIGMVYEFSPQTSMHAGYARYFTPPPTELITTANVNAFANTTNSPEVFTNDPVQPERSNYFDIGVVTSPVRGWTVGLDGYYKRASELLDLGQFGTALVFSPFNYQEGRVYGVELTNGWRSGPWDAYLNLAWQQAQGKNINSSQFFFGADELQYIASHWIYLDHDQTLTGSAGVSYTWQKTTFTGNLLYGSGLRTDSPEGVPNGAHVPGYVTVNVAAFRPFSLGQTLGEFTGRLSIVNLFNKSYQIRNGSGVGVLASQYGQPFSVYATVSKAFR
ncbi:MAG TPA: TonB-dependent receptor [Burkholderiales bacterium]|nr:TonB-dependent receptor [Burkholderiales bacterium]